MYEESSKTCDAEIDAITGELDETVKSTTTDTNTVWIRTKKKTTSNSTAAAEPPKRKTIRLADEV